jgi:hypothetical protein
VTRRIRRAYAVRAMLGVLVIILVISMAAHWIAAIFH